MTPERREGVVLVAAGCLPFVVGALVSRDGTDLIPGCPFRTLTGLPCPLCGGTRAFAWAARGDSGFLSYNGFWVFVALAVILAGVFVLATRVRVLDALTRTPPRAILLLGGLGAAGWVWALAERATIAPPG
ncbi:DUF2752 domain-containing protein [Solirubrobacter phytolaccae]|uniref:DUF2752 domain-containing protein n=1 Tax=Solirubrobacter phytolaccae TaxID=1404360 RepID=A0A9X3SIZ8_9ACTN|nr:DUF2752 domain-containing protein [Solirubrobacter phytolaccae]MDA0184727.1 DUF2752 domain-containing protein [Solirubrobacter phytolaccae]